MLSIITSQNLKFKDHLWFCVAISIKIQTHLANIDWNLSTFLSNFLCENYKLKRSKTDW